MQEEIFGPVMVIKTYERLEECSAYINAHPRPLGLYIFSRERSDAARACSTTRCPEARASTT